MNEAMPLPPETDGAAYVRRALLRAQDEAQERGYFRRGQRYNFGGGPKPQTNALDQPGSQADEPQNRAGQAGLNAKQQAQPGGISGGVSAGQAGRRSTWIPGPGLARPRVGPGPSRFDPQPLAAVLPSMLQRYGWEENVQVGAVVGRWAEIVGQDIADHCQIESFEDGVLCIRASSTPWATQLRLLQPVLLRRLDEEVGAGVVKKVCIAGPAAPSWKHGLRSVPGRGPRDTFG